jgi:predicted RNA-binding protein YlqC (UPF0109 family)
MNKGGSMSVEIDQQFVEYVVKSLVGNPDAVSINRTIDEKGVLLELTVDPEDLGRVIGKRGGTAQSIRTLLRALGTKNDARYNLKIVDTDGGSGARSSAPKQDDTSTPVQDDTPAPVQDEPAEDSITPEEPQEDNTVEEVQDEPVENEESELAAKTRKDLADLDDLDI